MPKKPEGNTPNDVVELLRSMIRFDTVTPRDSGRSDAEHALAGWLHGLAESWGFATRWLPVDGFSPNLLVTCEVDPSAPWWLFDSHLDTVGVEGMTIDPFGGDLRDVDAGGGQEPRILGRGACDTKGTGAAMLWALRDTRDAGALAANAAVLFTVCEEDHQQGAVAFVERGLDEIGWRPDAVVVGEPTGMQAVAASNGFVRWKLRTLGAAAHSSTPERGHNAILDMAHAVQWLQERHVGPANNAPDPHPLTGGGSCSINVIRGGAQCNIVPETCEVAVDQRVPPGREPRDEIATVETLMAELADRHAGLRWEITNIETAPPFDSPPSRRLADRTAAFLRDASIASSVVGAPYTTNANHYAAAGLPCVVLGPGDIAMAHTKAESIGVAQLREGVTGYAAMMRERPA
ncbi:MAG: M20/M25/M40 family metallo-hydrolase [Planctomycetota bacterium]